MIQSCVVCGAIFRGRAGAKYCNGRCRQRAYRARQAGHKCDVTDGDPAGEVLVLRPKLSRFSGSVGLVIAWDRGQGWREVV